MAYQDNFQRPQRQMFDVASLGIVCAECGVAIDKLPFQPNVKEDGTYGRIFCYECKKKQAPRGPRRSFGNDFGRRDDRRF